MKPVPWPKLPHWKPTQTSHVEEPPILPLLARFTLQVKGGRGAPLSARVWTTQVARESSEVSGPLLNSNPKFCPSKLAGSYQSSMEKSSSAKWLEWTAKEIFRFSTWRWLIYGRWASVLGLSQTPRGSAPPEYNGASHGRHDCLDCILSSCAAKPLNSDIPGI